MIQGGKEVGEIISLYDDMLADQFCRQVGITLGDGSGDLRVFFAGGLHAPAQTQLDAAIGTEPARRGWISIRPDDES